MGIISKLFNVVPKDERKGIRLDGNSAWEIKRNKKNYDTFLLELKNILPEDTIIYIEGTSIVKEVKDYYSTHTATTVTKVEMGTIWPRPAMYHIPASSENMNKLAYFFNHYAEPEICDHLVIYHSGKVLISGYDFLCPVVCATKDFSEKCIKEFCGKVNCTYKVIKIR